MTGDSIRRARRPDLRRGARARLKGGLVSAESAIIVSAKRQPVDVPDERRGDPNRDENHQTISEIERELVKALTPGDRGTQRLTEVALTGSHREIVAYSKRLSELPHPQTSALRTLWTIVEGAHKSAGTTSRLMHAQVQGKHWLMASYVHDLVKTHQASVASGHEPVYGGEDGPAARLRAFQDGIDTSEAFKALLSFVPEDERVDFFKTLFSIKELQGEGSPLSQLTLAQLEPICETLFKPIMAGSDEDETKAAIKLLNNIKSALGKNSDRLSRAFANVFERKFEALVQQDIAGSDPKGPAIIASYEAKLQAVLDLEETGLFAGSLLKVVANTAQSFIPSLEPSERDGFRTKYVIEAAIVADVYSPAGGIYESVLESAEPVDFSAMVKAVDTATGFFAPDFDPAVDSRGISPQVVSCFEKHGAGAARALEQAIEFNESRISSFEPTLMKGFQTVPATVLRLTRPLERRISAMRKTPLGISKGTDMPKGTLPEPAELAQSTAGQILTRWQDEADEAAGVLKANSGQLYTESAELANLEERFCDLLEELKTPTHPPREVREQVKALRLELQELQSRLGEVKESRWYRLSSTDRAEGRITKSSQKILELMRDDILPRTLVRLLAADQALESQATGQVTHHYYDVVIGKGKSAAEAAAPPTDPETKIAKEAYTQLQKTKTEFSKAITSLQRGSGREFVLREKLDVIIAESRADLVHVFEKVESSFDYVSSTLSGVLESLDSSAIFQTNMAPAFESLERLELFLNSVVSVRPHNIPKDDWKRFEAAVTDMKTEVKTLKVKLHQLNSQAFDVTRSVSKYVSMEKGDTFPSFTDWQARMESRSARSMIMLRRYTGPGTAVAAERCMADAALRALGKRDSELGGVLTGHVEDLAEHLAATPYSELSAAAGVHSVTLGTSPTAGTPEATAWTEARTRLAEAGLITADEDGAALRTTWLRPEIREHVLRSEHMDGDRFDGYSARDGHVLSIADLRAMVRPQSLTGPHTHYQKQWDAFLASMESSIGASFGRHPSADEELLIQALITGKVRGSGSEAMLLAAAGAGAGADLPVRVAVLKSLSTGNVAGAFRAAYEQIFSEPRAGATDVAKLTRSVCVESLASYDPTEEAKEAAIAGAEEHGDVAVAKTKYQTSVIQKAFHKAFSASFHSQTPAEEACFAELLSQLSVGVADPVNAAMHAGLKRIMGSAYSQRNAEIIIEEGFLDPIASPAEQKAKIFVAKYKAILNCVKNDIGALPAVVNALRAATGGAPGVSEEAADALLQAAKIAKLIMDDGLTAQRLNALSHSGADVPVGGASAEIAIAKTFLHDQAPTLQKTLTYATQPRDLAVAAAVRAGMTAKDDESEGFVKRAAVDAGLRTKIASFGINKPERDAIIVAMSADTGARTDEEGLEAEYPECRNKDAFRSALEFALKPKNEDGDRKDFAVMKDADGFRRMAQASGAVLEGLDDQTLEAIRSAAEFRESFYMAETGLAVVLQAKIAAGDGDYIYPADFSVDILKLMEAIATAKTEHTGKPDAINAAIVKAMESPVVIAHTDGRDLRGIVGVTDQPAEANALYGAIQDAALASQKRLAVIERALALANSKEVQEAEGMNAARFIQLLGEQDPVITVITVITVIGDGGEDEYGSVPAAMATALFNAVREYRVSLTATLGQGDKGSTTLVTTTPAQLLREALKDPDTGDETRFLTAEQKTLGESLGLISGDPKKFTDTATTPQILAFLQQVGVLGQEVRHFSDEGQSPLTKIAKPLQTLGYIDATGHVTANVSAAELKMLRDLGLVDGTQLIEQSVVTLIKQLHTPPTQYLKLAAASSSTSYEVDSNHLNPTMAEYGLLVKLGIIVPHRCSDKSNLPPLKAVRQALVAEGFLASRSARGHLILNPGLGEAALKAKFAKALLTNEPPANSLKDSVLAAIPEAGRRSLVDRGFLTLKADGGYDFVDKDDLALIISFLETTGIFTTARVAPDLRADAVLNCSVKPQDAAAKTLAALQEQRIIGFLEGRGIGRTDSHRKEMAKKIADGIVSEQLAALSAEYQGSHTGSATLTVPEGADLRHWQEYSGKRTLEDPMLTAMLTQKLRSSTAGRNAQPQAATEMMDCLQSLKPRDIDYRQANGQGLDELAHELTTVQKQLESRRVAIMFITPGDVTEEALATLPQDLQDAFESLVSDFELNDDNVYELRSAFDTKVASFSPEERRQFCLAVRKLIRVLIEGSGLELEDADYDISDSDPRDMAEKLAAKMTRLKTQIELRRKIQNPDLMRADASSAMPDGIVFRDLPEDMRAEIAENMLQRAAARAGVAFIPPGFKEKLMAGEPVTFERPKTGRYFRYLGQDLAGSWRYHEYLGQGLGGRLLGFGQDLVTRRRGDTAFLTVKIPDPITLPSSRFLPTDKTLTDAELQARIKESTSALSKPEAAALRTQLQNLRPVLIAAGFDLSGLAGTDLSRQLVALHQLFNRHLPAQAEGYSFDSARDLQDLMIAPLKTQISVIREKAVAAATASEVGEYVADIEVTAHARLTVRKSELTQVAKETRKAVANLELLRAAATTSPMLTELFKGRADLLGAAAAQLTQLETFAGAGSGSAPSQLSALSSIMHDQRVLFGSYSTHTVSSSRVHLAEWAKTKLGLDPAFLSGSRAAALDRLLDQWSAQLTQLRSEAWRAANGDMAAFDDLLTDPDSGFSIEAFVRDTIEPGLNTNKTALGFLSIEPEGLEAIVFQALHLPPVQDQVETIGSKLVNMIGDTYQGLAAEMTQRYDKLITEQSGELAEIEALDQLFQTWQICMDSLQALSIPQAQKDGILVLGRDISTKRQAMIAEFTANFESLAGSPVLAATVAANDAAITALAKKLGVRGGTTLEKAKRIKALLNEWRLKSASTEHFSHKVLDSVDDFQRAIHEDSDWAAAKASLEEQGGTEFKQPNSAAAADGDDAATTSGKTAHQLKIKLEARRTALNNQIQILQAKLQPYYAQAEGLDTAEAYRKFPVIAYAHERIAEARREYMEILEKYHGLLPDGDAEVHGISPSVFKAEVAVQLTESRQEFVFAAQDATARLSACTSGDVQVTLIDDVDAFGLITSGNRQILQKQQILRHEISEVRAKLTDLNNKIAAAEEAGQTEIEGIGALSTAIRNRQDLKAWLTVLEAEVVTSENLDNLLDERTFDGLHGSTVSSGRYARLKAPYVDRILEACQREDMYKPVIPADDDVKQRRITLEIAARKRDLAALKAAKGKDTSVLETEIETWLVRLTPENMGVNGEFDGDSRFVGLFNINTTLTRQAQLELATEAAAKELVTTDLATITASALAGPGLFVYCSDVVENKFEEVAPEHYTPVKDSFSDRWKSNVKALVAIDRGSSLWLEMFQQTHQLPLVVNGIDLADRQRIVQRLLAQTMAMLEMQVKDSETYQELSQVVASLAMEKALLTQRSLMQEIAALDPTERTSAKLQSYNEKIAKVIADLEAASIGLEWVVPIGDEEPTAEQNIKTALAQTIGFMKLQGHKYHLAALVQEQTEIVDSYKAIVANSPEELAGKANALIVAMERLAVLGSEAVSIDSELMVLKETAVFRDVPTIIGDFNFDGLRRVVEPGVRIELEATAREMFGHFQGSLQSVKDEVLGITGGYSQDLSQEERERLSLKLAEANQKRKALETAQREIILCLEDMERRGDPEAAGMIGSLEALSGEMTDIADRVKDLRPRLSPKPAAMLPDRVAVVTGSLDEYIARLQLGHAQHINAGNVMAVQSEIQRALQSVREILVAAKLEGIAPDSSQAVGTLAHGLSQLIRKAREIQVAVKPLLSSGHHIDGSRTAAVSKAILDQIGFASGLDSLIEKLDIDSVPIKAVLQTIFAAAGMPASYTAMVDELSGALRSIEDLIAGFDPASDTAGTTLNQIKTERTNLVARIKFLLSKKNAAGNTIMQELESIVVANPAVMATIEAINALQLKVSQLDSLYSPYPSSFDDVSNSQLTIFAARAKEELSQYMQLSRAYQSAGESTKSASLDKHIQDRRVILRVLAKQIEIRAAKSVQADANALTIEGSVLSRDSFRDMSSLHKRELVELRKAVAVFQGPPISRLGALLTEKTTSLFAASEDLAVTVSDVEDITPVR